MRAALLLGNANNGGNAGSLYLNGNNGVSNANANYGAFLNNDLKKGEPDLLVKNDKDNSEPRNISERHTCWMDIADTSQTPTKIPTKTP